MILDTSAKSKPSKAKWCNFELLVESLVWYPKVRTLGVTRPSLTVLAHAFKHYHHLESSSLLTHCSLVQSHLWWLRERKVKCWTAEAKAKVVMITRANIIAESQITVRDENNDFVCLDWQVHGSSQSSGRNVWKLVSTTTYLQRPLLSTLDIRGKAVATNSVL